MEEALQQEDIEPSTSPSSVRFFFVEKKGGGLRPCIDYRGLNGITVKYSYPLPLVPSCFRTALLSQNFYKAEFTKCNLVRI